MAIAQSTIATFSSGELDPRMRGRTDVKQYLQGALRLRNFRQLAQGGVQTRPGTDFVIEIPEDGRLIPFIFSEDQSYLLAFVQQQIRVFENSSGVWNNIQTIQTSYNLQQIKELDFTQFSDTMIIVHENKRINVLKRLTFNTFSLSDFEFDGDDKGEYIFQPYHKFTSSDTHLRANNPASNPTYNAGDSITIGIYRNNGTTGVTDFWKPGHIGLRISILDPSDNVLKEVEVTALHPGGILQDATVTIKKDFGTTGTTLYASTTNTLDWGEPLFSDLRGFPSTACFREGRLWFNGPRTRPSALVASKTEQFFNFDVGTALDDDAIDFNAATSEVRKIEYLIPGRDLTIFTDGAEMFTSVDDGEALTPTNMNVKPQTYFGCKRVKPFVFDGAILFVQRGRGKNIREYHFKDLSQAYESPSVSILAGHLIEDPVDSAVLVSSNYPEQYAFFVMANGSMAVLHSIREQESRGWALWFPGTNDAGQTSNTVNYANSDTRFSSTTHFMSQLDLFTSEQSNDKFKSVTVVNDDIFVITERRIGGRHRHFIERFNTKRYFDLATTVSSPTATRNFGGLLTYAGQKVAVRARNAFLGHYTVDELGNITLQDTIEPQVQVEIGLPFLSYLQPMPFDANTRSGTLSGRKRRLSRLIVETYDTLSLKVENDVILTRNVTDNLPGQPIARNGPYEFNFLGYSRDPTITLALNEPMRATILSMSAEIAY